MKRKLLALVASLAFLLLFLTGCSSKQDNTKSIGELEAQIVELQSNLEKVSSERDKLGQENSTLKAQLEDSKKKTEVTQSDVTVKIVDKINIPKNADNWQFQNLVNFHISITNNTDKEIKGIQGELDIQDMFGVSILKSKCDLTGYTIKPQETVINKDLSLEINEFMNDHAKVFNTDYNDLIFVYSVKQIMFTDGSTKQ